MKIALLQYPVEWANPSANVRALSERLRVIKGQADIAVVPEMFSTGFCTDRPDLAEPWGGTTCQALQQMAELRDKNNNLSQEEFTAKLQQLAKTQELVATEEQIAQFANMSAAEMRAEAVTRGENVTKAQGELQILIRYVNLLNKLNQIRL